ncbi:hypothetical protein EV715DRAFT_289423 [Schizophyllum commune]
MSERGCGGRLNARSPRSSPNLPTFRWAGLGRGPSRSDPEKCDAGLEIWAATGHGQPLTPFLLSYPPSPTTPFESYCILLYSTVQFPPTTSLYHFYLVDLAFFDILSIDTERNYRVECVNELLLAV